MTGKKKVLIVEDTKHFALLLEEMINEQHDFEVVGKSADGFEGLRDIVALKPDVVILDIIMPNLDGLGVLEELNKLVQNGELIAKPRIIVLSAVGLDNIARSALSLGADYCILKPFDFNAFMVRMRQIAHSYEAEASEDLHSVEFRLINMLELIGVPKHIKGYRYISEAVMMVYQNAESINKMTSVIYPSIADRYNTNAASVERAMRNAVDLTLNKGEGEAMELLSACGTSKTGRISNTEFISLLICKLKSN